MKIKFIKLDVHNFWKHFRRAFTMHYLILSTQLQKWIGICNYGKIMLMLKQLFFIPRKKKLEIWFGTTNDIRQWLSTQAVEYFNDGLRNLKKR